jgi:hypothetical protein
MSSVTHRAAHPHRWIRSATPLAALALAALALAACGSQKSTLPPAPGSAGTVSLRDLAKHPEVYADATVSAVGTVARVARAGPPLYTLQGGHGTRIVLEPSTSAARYAGRSVRVSGVFTVSFALGYEILVSKITPTATL